MSFSEEELIDYLNVKSAYQSKAIPFMNKFTFVSKKSGFGQLWTLSNDGEPIEYVKTEDRVMNYFHSPTGQYTVLGIDHRGNEKQQLHLYDAETHHITPLNDFTDNFHFIGGWSPNEKYISYSSNRREPGYFDIYIYNIETGETEKVFQYNGNCVPLQWVDNERLFFYIRSTTIEGNIYCLNVKSSESTLIGKHDQHARFSSIVAKKDGMSGYLLTDYNEDNVYLSHYSLREPENLTKLFQWENWDLEEISLSPNEEHLAFTVNEDGYLRLWLYDLDSQQKEQIEGLPDGVIDSLAWLNEDQLIFTLKAATVPGDIWQLSLSDRKIERLTYLSESEGIENNWVEPTLYSYESFDHLKVPYFFYDIEKDNKEEKPAVIYVHGGPEMQTKSEFNPTIQYLVKLGYAVAAPNVRGSIGYGRTYEELDDGRQRMDSVKDLKWLVKDLIDSRDVSPKKIAIMGRSYGGFMVLAAMTHFPDLWAGGVDIVGVSNIKTLLQNTGAWRRHLRECEYGKLEDHSDFFDEIAPINNSEQIKAPLLVFHGRNDTRVPISESEKMVSEMKGRNQSVEFIVFEDEGHQTEKLENIINMNVAIIDFLNKNLDYGQ